MYGQFSVIYYHLGKDYIERKIILKRLAFSLKFLTILPSTERVGIIGIILQLQHDLIIDQYVSGLIFRLLSFNDKL